MSATSCADSAVLAKAIALQARRLHSPRCHPIVFARLYSAPSSSASRTRAGVRIASFSSSRWSCAPLAAFDHEARSRRAEVRVRAYGGLPRRRVLCRLDPAHEPWTGSALSRIRRGAGRRGGAPGGPFEPHQFGWRRAGKSSLEQPFRAQAPPPSTAPAPGPVRFPQRQLAKPEPARRHVGPSARLEQLRRHAEHNRERRDVRQSDRRRQTGLRGERAHHRGRASGHRQSVRSERRHVQRQRFRNLGRQPQRRQSPRSCRPRPASRPTSPFDCGNSGTSRNSPTSSTSRLASRASTRNG